MVAGQEIAFVVVHHNDVVFWFTAASGPDDFYDTTWWTIVGTFRANDIFVPEQGFVQIHSNVETSMRKHDERRMTEKISKHPPFPELHGAIMRSRQGHALVLLIGLLCPVIIPAQSLPDSILQKIRAGVARVVVPADSVAMQLVGSPTLPLIEANINGIGPYRLLIDLGSNVTLLRRNVVDASGSVVLIERSSSDIVHVETIQLGDALLESVTAASYDELDVDGILGYNVLQYSSFTLDFLNQRFVLHRKSLPSTVGISIFSFQIQERMPYVTVMLGKDSLMVNLDTGASEALTIPIQLHSRFRWLAPPQPGRSVFNNQTGRTQILEGYLADTLRLGAFRIASPLVYLNPTPITPGLDVLR